jgi:4-aminobutyrate aminotransferase-like enzyme/Ser/Thr protein kinase RdoA (MazF antagonist)
MESNHIDAVMTREPPRFDAHAAVDIAAATFGVSATAAVDLGSERDQTFLLHRGESATPAVMPVVMPVVMKVSNAAEDPAMLDMESAALEHAQRVDPSLPLVMPWVVPGSSGRRAAFHHDGATHWVRMYDAVQGRARIDATTLSDRALVEWGRTTARLGRALRGYGNACALRTLPWDVQHASQTRPMVAAIADTKHADLVTSVLDRFDAVVTPLWPSLRAQVVHGDLTVDNAIVDDSGTILGILDFGDMSHTALIVDVVSALDSVCGGRPGDEMLRAARLLLDGYQAVTPLEDDELRLLGELWAARTAVGVAIASWRVERGLESAEFGLRYVPSSIVAIEQLLDLGWDRIAYALGAPVRIGSMLQERRDRVFGPAMEPLSYDEPLTMASASGVHMFDDSGRRFLDLYNNVPCVGHAHPRITSAVSRQLRTLTTNLRYLHPAPIELAERLVALCPDGLDTVLFVNSGSEANDLAVRLVRAATGRSGLLCTEFAYHGVTEALEPLSPEVLPSGSSHPTTERWDPRSFDGVTAASQRLAARGVGVAAAILDGVLLSDGVLVPEPATVAGWVDQVRAAGGLWIADEVQGGHGRTGVGMWAFERFGIVPDVITLGKPMGNGHPVAAVITRRDIAAALATTTRFFSTFAGSPVAAAAALAVLDVIDDEGVIERTRIAGERLRRELRAALGGLPAVGEVRGIGLSNAVELIDAVDGRPDDTSARAIVGRLRHAGVLIGTTGPFGNVLKIRPPLAFSSDHVDEAVNAIADAVDRVLATTARRAE